MNKNIEWGVKKIKDISFFINENLHVSDPSKIVKIELGQTLGFNIENNLLNFTIIIYFHYQDEPQNRLAEIKVENIFEVKKLGEVTTNGTIIPPQLLLAVLGMSISHGRALFSKNLAGTIFQDIILPVTNPLDVGRFFFPEIFVDTQTEILEKQDAINTNTKKRKVNKV